MKVLKEVIATYTEEYGKIKITETPLVRCGECTEWHEYARQNMGRCDCWFITTEPTDFCSYGERRNDEKSL